MNDFLNKAVGVPWLDKGRDFNGWDCWGLVVCFYSKIFNIDLKSFDNCSFCGNPKIALKTMMEEVKNWVQFELGKEKIGDVILLKPLHAGIVVGNEKMLHCQDIANTCIERYNSRLWKNRIIGFYRHAKHI